MKYTREQELSCTCPREESGDAEPFDSRCPLHGDHVLRHDPSEDEEIIEDDPNFVPGGGKRALMPIELL